ncbi:MAG: hypothetical protein WBE97_12450 [Candidatus Acidiferrales bacterium]
MSDYSQQWEACKKLSSQFLFAFVVELSIIVASICFSAAIRRNFVASLVLESLWVVVFFVTAIRLQNFRCPRCAEKFFASPRYHNVFARQCLNCGLQKYSN